MKIKNPFKFKLLRKIFGTIISHIRKSIRLELIVTFIICLIAFFVTAFLSDRFLFDKSKISAYIDYTYEIRDANDILKNTSERFNSYSINAASEIQNIIDNNYGSNTIEMMLTDVDGTVLFKSKNVNDSKVDIYDVINNYVSQENNLNSINYENRRTADNNQRKTLYSILPLKLTDGEYYLIARYIPQGIIKYKNDGSSTLASLITGILSFIFLFYYITKRKMKYIEELSQGLVEIAKGNLNYTVDKKGEDELASLSKNINFMASELNDKIDRERKAEKTKSDLITNVSHDLRTPLTSIMGYLGLVKSGKYENKEQLEEYTNIAYTKSEKLRLLIEDLFEYTKLSNEGISVNKEPIALNEFLEQLIEELVPIFEENNLDIEKEMPHEKIFVNLDVTKSLRLFENLIMNAVKYSYKPGIIKIKLYTSDDNVIVCVENSGDNIPKEDLAKLFDRFYRQDKARTSDIGGSGLGLAIAKSITELQGGRIWAECEDQDIRFYVSFKNKGR